MTDMDTKFEEFVSKLQATMAKLEPLIDGNIRPEGVNIVTTGTHRTQAAILQLLDTLPTQTMSLLSFSKDVEQAKEMADTYLDAVQLMLNIAVDTARDHVHDETAISEALLTGEIMDRLTELTADDAMTYADALHIVVTEFPDIDEDLRSRLVSKADDIDALKRMRAEAIAHTS